MGPRRVSVPPTDHIDLEPPIQIQNPVGVAQLFRDFRFHSEDPLRRSFDLQKPLQWLPLPLKQLISNVSPRIAVSVAHPDLSQHSKCCTTQVVVTTLQLRGQLWILKISISETIPSEVSIGPSPWRLSLHKDSPKRRKSSWRSLRQLISGSHRDG